MGIIDTLLSDIPQKDCIYHYTSQKTLLDLLKDEEIWATHIEYFDDRSEFTYAMEKVHSALRRRTERILQQGSSGSDLSLVNKLREELGGTRFLKINVCSFTCEGNLLRANKVRVRS